MQESQVQSGLQTDFEDYREVNLVERSFLIFGERLTGIQLIKSNKANVEQKTERTHELQQILKLGGGAGAEHG